jgi:hypothetical protein
VAPRLPAPAVVRVHLRRAPPKPTDRPTTLDPPSTSRPLAYARARVIIVIVVPRPGSPPIVVVVIVVVVVLLLLEHDVAIHPIPRVAPPSTRANVAPPRTTTARVTITVIARPSSSNGVVRRLVSRFNFKCSSKDETATTDTRRDSRRVTTQKTNQYTGLSRGKENPT